MAAPSPRRRFQFRLRTLMIAVTLLAAICGCMAHGARIVAARIAWLKSHPPLAIAGSDFGSDSTALVIGEPSQCPSLLRLWLGDSEQRRIDVSPQISPSELHEITALFPEATISADYRMKQQNWAQAWAR